jgi:uncharacterized membrane protein
MGDAFTPHQRNLVARIVHNAGIYNGILARAWRGLHYRASPHMMSRVLLAGAAVAGLFGTVTIKSAPTAVQAAPGITGLPIV